MDKSHFWKLIDDARRDVSSIGEVAGLLSEKLAEMDISDILRWQQIFDAYFKISRKRKLWAAAYVIHGGCGDDCFDYFRAGLIALGRDVFLVALADPDSLATVDVEDIEEDLAGGEDMLYVGVQAYFKKLGMPEGYYERFDAACDEHAWSEDERQALAADIHFPPDIDLDWEEDELESVVPALCAKFP